MIKPTRPITDPIKRNKPLLFSRPNTKDASKKQAKVVALKDDFSLFPGFISRANFVKVIFKIFSDTKPAKDSVTNPAW